MEFKENVMVKEGENMNNQMLTQGDFFETKAWEVICILRENHPEIEAFETFIFECELGCYLVIPIFKDGYGHPINVFNPLCSNDHLKVKVIQKPLVGLKGNMTDEEMDRLEPLTECETKQYENWTPFWVT